MDMFSKEKRSAIMSKIKSKWTKPEKRVYQGMKDRGLDPAVHEDQLPGKPDFVFMRRRIAIMVEGCFWHGCPKHYKKPKSNKQFWFKKIDDNIRRDVKNRRKLRLQGFGVIRIWECATIGHKLDMSLNRVERMLEAAHG